MNFIGIKEDLEKNQVLKLVYGLLLENVDDTDSYLYYKYPFYKGQIQDDLIETELLFVSAKYGIYCFNSEMSCELTEMTSNKIDSLYNEISSRFMKFSELRKSKGRLKYEINTVVVGNFEQELQDDDYRICTVDKFESFVKEEICLEGKSIPVKDFELINSCIDGSFTLQKKKERNVDAGQTKAALLNKIQANIASFDLQQKQIASVNIDTPQRVRGLAGSGKTVILAYKAAIFHARYPDKKILYTFYTKSLADSVRDLITRAYRNIHNASPNWDNITICHGWGSSIAQGVYYNTCIHNNVIPLTLTQARGHGMDPFAYICKRLNEVDIKPEYDMILIDEGQDFPVDFYRLCYKLCFEVKRICWAYDDFQNIFDVNIQNEKETFGYNVEGKAYVDFSKQEHSYSDTILKKCYRTPRYSLICAFTIGLGIYNSKVLQRLESNFQWESLGFLVEEGNSKTDDQMVISRPEENSPTYSNEIFGPETIKMKKFKDYNEECNAIVHLIEKSINIENLLPSDLCVICIDNKNIGHYFERIQILLSKKDIHSFNLLRAPNENTSFFLDGHVTLSSVNKAKGNECGMVIICGTDAVFDQPDNVIMRDRLFTSMTRTKGWLYLTGCTDSMDLLLEEYEQLKKHDYKLIFVQPDKSSTKNIENVSKATYNAKENFASQIEKLRKTGLSDNEIKTLFNRLFEK